MVNGKSMQSQHLQESDILEVLEYVEWAGDHTGSICCPYCLGLKYDYKILKELYPHSVSYYTDGHTEDCKLKAILDRLRAIL
jgi:hypothetical protein